MTTVDASHEQGWGTTPEAGPHFTIGRQRLDADGLHTDTGPVWNDQLGIEVPDAPFNTPAWGALTASDLETVLDDYTDAFTDPATTAAVLAAMARPTICLPPRTTLALTGPPASSTSLAATLALAGWQPTPGTLARHGLPGTGDDTPELLDYAIQHCPIWGVDNADQGSPEHTSKTVRAVSNGRLPTRITATGTPEPPRRSRGLLVLTAEDLHLLASSARSRLVEVALAPSAWASTADTRRAASVRDFSGAPARTVGALLQLELSHIRNGPDRLQTEASWLALKAWPRQPEPPRRSRGLRHALTAGVHERAAAIQRRAPQPAQAVADLSLGLVALHDLATFLGVRHLAERITDLTRALEASQAA